LPDPSPDESPSPAPTQSPSPSPTPPCPYENYPECCDKCFLHPGTANTWGVECNKCQPGTTFPDGCYKKFPDNPCPQGTTESPTFGGLCCPQAAGTGVEGFGGHAA
jgi:hypothetical protein